MSAGKAQQGRIGRKASSHCVDEEIRSESCRQAVRVGKPRARLPVEDCSLVPCFLLSTSGKASGFADGGDRAGLTGLQLLPQGASAGWGTVRYSSPFLPPHA